MGILPSATIECPGWAEAATDWDRPYPSDHERMGLAIALARENVRRGEGGPFGAAVFESDSGRLIAIGVNRVVATRNSLLHAEVMALVLAQQRLGRYTLRGDGAPAHDLVCSCEPCAMCLGAALWAGPQRLLLGARRQDAIRIGFEEGPVFAASYEYVARRGVEVVRDVCRDEAAAVLESYARAGGTIYNG